MEKIAQIGSFDVDNFGDLLFPYVLKNKIGKEIQIDLYSPNKPKSIFTEFQLFSFEHFEENCKKNNYSAVIVGGGDLIRADSEIFIRNNCYSTNSESSLSLWAYPILIAKKYNIPVLFNAPGVTKNFNQIEAPLIKCILNMVDYLNVRDSEAKKTLECIGIFNANLVPDTVASISSIYSKDYLRKIYCKLVEEGVISRKCENYIVFQHNTTNIQDGDYYNQLVKFINHVSRNNNILFMPIGYIHDDDKVLDRIYFNNIPNTFNINKTKLSIIEQLAILANSSGFIGTSMHGAVVSYSYDKPIMSLNSMNSKKIHGFSNLINNTKLDLNNISDANFIFDSYFRKVKNIKKEIIINKIDQHFNVLKEFINNPIIKCNTSVDFKKIIDHIYFENDICYCVEKENDVLNRKINKYYFKDDISIFDFTDVDEEFKFYPALNRIIYIEKIYVNEKVVAKDLYATKYTYFIVSRFSIVKIIGRFVEDDEFFECFNSQKNIITELEEEKQNLKISLHQAEQYYEDYKDSVAKKIMSRDGEL